MPKKMTMMKNVLSRRKPLGDASEGSGGTFISASDGSHGTTTTIDPSLVTKMSLTRENGAQVAAAALSSSPSQPTSAQIPPPRVTQASSSPPVSPTPTPPRRPSFFELAPPGQEIDGTKAEESFLNAAYDRIPLLEIIELPRGGVSIETQAVGYVQYGIPPETIKDSMRLGIAVPSVYIVPVDRFCREMGPALGVNLAEFEFPAYFNFFVQRKRCTLVVDSVDAERNIQRVFSETLLGPLPFRRKENPLTHAEEGE
jgi:hypothetical protein